MMTSFYSSCQVALKKQHTDTMKQIAKMQLSLLQLYKDPTCVPKIQQTKMPMRPLNQSQNAQTMPLAPKIKRTTVKQLDSTKKPISTAAAKLVANAAAQIATSAVLVATTSNPVANLAGQVATSAITGAAAVKPIANTVGVVATTAKPVATFLETATKKS